MLQAIIWYAAALLAAMGALAVLQWRAARRLAAEPGKAAGILHRFSRRGGTLTGFIMVPMILIGPLFNDPIDDARQRQAIFFILCCMLVVALLGISCARLGLERPLRPSDWSRAAMMRVHLFFYLPVLGTLLLAALGELLSLIVLESLGYPHPSWIGAVWVLAAAAIVMLAPTERLLGRAIDPPADLLDEFRERAAISDPPPLVVLDTGGAHLVNAFAFWVPGRSWIAVGDGLLESLDRPQMISVLMHELGHMVHRDARRQVLVVLGFQALATAMLMWAGAASSWTAFATLVLGTVVVWPWFSRRAEHRCDLFAAERTDPQVMGAALRRLHELNFQPAHHDQGEHTTHPDLAHRLEALGVDLEGAGADSWEPLSRGARVALAWFWGLSAFAAVVLLMGASISVMQRDASVAMWFLIVIFTWLAYYGMNGVYYYTTDAAPRRLPPWVAAGMVAYWAALEGLATEMQGWLLAACVLAVFGGLWVLMVRFRGSWQPRRCTPAIAPAVLTEPMAQAPEVGECG